MKAQKENTKLIAEFMGLKKSDRLYKDHFTYVGDDIKKAGFPFTSIMGNCMDELPFETSWDWLMPVVDKICNICFADTEQKTAAPEYFYKIRDCVPYIHQTYKAVIEFIKYYNY